MAAHIEEGVQQLSMLRRRHAQNGAPELVAGQAQRVNGQIHLIHFAARLGSGILQLLGHNALKEADRQLRQATLKRLLLHGLWTASPCQ